MGNDGKIPHLVQTRWGFFQYDPMPNELELRAYYAEKYYQQGKGSYEQVYSDEELAWKRLKSWLLTEKAQELVPGARNFLDIGCGEGCLLSEFHARGLIVTGMDFSEAGIRHLHPEMLPFFQQGNVFDLIETNCVGNQFDTISCINVLEHVTDPVKMLNLLKQGLSQTGVLIITVPNDFSKLHSKLVQDGITPDRWWICFPDHLSYFNQESMLVLLQDTGFRTCAIVADNPIDLNLLNPNSNYIIDREKGKGTHLFRVRTDNFLAEISRKKLLRLYEAYGDMGIGRNLTYYCMLAQ